MFGRRSAGYAPYRLTLPTRWKSGDPRRLRLTRRFLHPSLGVGMSVLLQMEDVPGIHRLELNGHPSAAISPGRAEYEISLDRAAVRQELYLEIEPILPRDSESASPEWGRIALVIRPTNQAGSPPAFPAGER